MFSNEDIQQMGSLPSAERQKLTLAPGDDVENSPWRNLYNMRLQVDGQYVFWKTRGGSTLVNSFFGNVLTVYPMEAEVDGVVKEYLAVHTAAGHVYLWDISAGTSNQIANGVFSTSQQIQFANIGRFLYMFDYDGGASRYYNMTEDTLNSFLDYEKSYIETVNWLNEGLSNPNIWDFRVGQDIIVWPNQVPESGRQIFSSSGLADGTSSAINPANYDVNSFLYIYNGGAYLKDESGAEYKKTQWITFDQGAQPFSFTVHGSGDAFTIETYYIPLDESGNAAFESYRTKIDAINNNIVSFKDPVGVGRSTVIGGVSDTDIGDINIILPYNPDLDDLVGVPSNKKINPDGDAIISNPAYENPKVYRQYVLFDMLEDGSITITGKPFQLEGDKTVIHKNGNTVPNFTISSPSPNVEKRFLCCTRWQPSSERAFNPSNENYSNSPLFIVSDVNTNRTFVKDRTVDSRLFRPITEFQPMAAGVSDLFTAGSLKPNSIAQFTGSLLLAGYTASRPTPVPYTAAATPNDGNVHINITPTTQLPNDMALAFQFEYTDGRRSSIVETEQFLQEGSTSSTTPIACDQNPAKGTHTVTAGVTTDGDIEITYDGITLTVSLTTASHSTPENVAEAIRQAVVGHADIRITADVPSGSDIEYTEKRYGEQFNGNVVDITKLPIAAVGFVDVNSSSLPAATPASAHYDVDANNLGSGASEDHTLTIDGNSTAAITINDTDTLEGIVDKYVTEINGNATISADWTATKVDNGDGTWRCLIESDVSDESWNGRAISISGNTDVTVSVNSPTAGGNDGEESHTITVGANTTAAISVTNADSVQQIAQKYVDAINNDGTISGGWTAALVDNGDGTWRCEITSDNPGIADNGTTISVTKSDTISAGSQVDTTSSDASGGADDCGVTFDTEDPSLSGANEPVGVPAKGFFVCTYAQLIDKDGQGQLDVVIDGQGLQNTITVTDQDTPAGIASLIASAISGDPNHSQNWTATTTDFTIDGQDHPGVTMEAKSGGTAFNGISFYSQDPKGIEVSYSAPGDTWDVTNSKTAGGDPGCIQAEAYIDVSANGLADGATEDHTISVDGNATAAITIADTDTTEQIVDKYIAEIRNTTAIDIDWEVAKSDQGGGTWRLEIIYRIYGTIGNNKTVSLSGDTGVTATVTSPSAGGEDAGNIATEPADEVSANLLQVHSLNQLVSKVYVLGRTNDGTKNFHLIDEFDITEPESHGKVIQLPNTESELNDIETDSFQPPATEDILETVELPSYLLVGTPFQQFQISTQERIVDQSEIQRAMPVDFASDTTVMRYRVMIFTDRNIQMGYLVDETTRSESGRTRRVFESDFEIAFSGMKTNSREGITDLFGQIIIPTDNGVYSWPRQGAPQQLFDGRRYGVSDNNNLVDVAYNQDHNEFWFVYGDSQIVVFDLNSQTTRRMEYSGIGSIRAGAFFGDKLYIGGGTDVLETDVDGVLTDKSAGDPVAAKAETAHIGNELSQMRLLELVVGGQNFSCSVDVDLQPERFEGDPATWSKSFNADKSITAKALKMHGASFQVQRMAVMPRLRLSFNAATGGFLSHVILKSVPTDNRGIARQ